MLVSSLLTVLLQALQQQIRDKERHLQVLYPLPAHMFTPP
jgi:hypothetical protein